LEKQPNPDDNLQDVADDFLKKNQKLKIFFQGNMLDVL
jgi:hypothetical protein